MEDIEFNGQDISKAMDLLSAFAGRRGWPPNVRAMQAAARGLLRIVHLEPREWMDGEVKRQCEKPAEWLIEEAYNATDMFPTMLCLRRIYEERFTPRDGRCSYEVEMS